MSRGDSSAITPLATLLRNASEDDLRVYYAIHEGVTRGFPRVSGYPREVVEELLRPIGEALSDRLNELGKNPLDFE